MYLVSPFLMFFSLLFYLSINIYKQEDESEAEQEDEPNNDQEDEPNTDQEDKSDTESEPESQDDSKPDHRQGDIGKVTRAQTFWLEKMEEVPVTH
ncbi:hypothetical protein CRE_13805 [Caenorhabditis remanei]|uniref:Uncharacterized protein n=1 Tax=Caenorhabditis remanei TaxID=31234 RepID=E3NM64_CAERE|nr:hypothetical protein CRE_13805 [Caenorhabditis remanei]